MRFTRAAAPAVSNLGTFDIDEKLSSVRELLDEIALGGIA
jgi:hypothetical protein